MKEVGITRSVFRTHPMQRQASLTIGPAATGSAVNTSVYRPPHSYSQFTLTSKPTKRRGSYSLFTGGSVTRPA